MHNHPMSSTSCSESWTLQRESWAAHGSTTAVWHSSFLMNCTLSFILLCWFAKNKCFFFFFSFTLSCTGSMWQIGSRTSSAMDGIQVSSRPSARLLVWAVHAGRSSRWTTASPFSQPQLARRPKVQLNTYGRRAFAVAAPATWNTLSDELRNPDLHSATFWRNLKTFLFQQYLVHWAH